MKQRYCQLFLAFSLVIVFYLNSFSQTQVKGGIYSSTTWTKANSPYIILDTVVVFSGATLTIQAGVTVKFNKNAFIVLRQTNIIAIGNKDDYITFTSNTVNPTAGIYSGIILNGGTLTSQFNYCKFYYASSGISSSGKDKKLYVKNSIFSYNKTGIRGYYTRVDSCNFTNNNEGVYSLHNYFEGINGGIINFCNISNNNYGVLIDYGIITNCNITYNQNGVKYRDGYCVVSLINCNISYNGKGVVYINTIINSTINYNDTAIYNNSQGDTDCFYVNCNIKNNNYGILGRGSGNSLRIQDCNIDSNKVIGIKLYSYNKDEVDPYDYITNCRIRNNGTGVEIEFASSINNNMRITQLG